MLAVPFFPVLISGFTVSAQLKHLCFSDVSKDTSEM